MGELPGRNVAKTGKGKNWKSRGRGKEKNMVVEYIPLLNPFNYEMRLSVLVATQSHSEVCQFQLFSWR